MFEIGVSTVSKGFFVSIFRWVKTSSLEEFLDKCSLTIFGNWLIISGGWFEDLLIYNNKSFGFLYGLYVPLFKLNVVAKKSATLRLVSTSMAKLMSLNVLITLLCIRSICWPFKFRNMSICHLYISHNLLYSLVSLKNTRCKYQQIRYLCTVKISHCHIEAAFCLFLFRWFIVAK